MKRGELQHNPYLNLTTETIVGKPFAQPMHVMPCLFFFTLIIHQRFTVNASVTFLVELFLLLLLFPFLLLQICMCVWTLEGSTK